MNGEKWIPGFEGLYSISRTGDVFSEPRICQRMNKETISNMYIGLTVLAKVVGKRGYYVVVLRKGGKSYNKYVHQLLAQTFIPNMRGVKCINHIDGNKTNNDINNLEWCTASENNSKAHHDGLVNYDRARFRGLRSYQTRRIYQFDLDGNFIAMYEGAVEAQRHTNIRSENIYKCIKGLRRHAGGYKRSLLPTI